MTDQLCPSCGKAALSVATRCPRCGQVFELRYDRHIDPKPIRPRVPGPALIVIAVITVLGANLLWRSGRSSPRPAAKPPAGAPAPAAATQAASTPPAPPPLARADSAAPKAANRAPQARAVDSAAVAKPVVRPTPRPVEPSPVGGSEQRFATTWINVRAVRSSKARVVRVLKPGEAVQVDSLGEGWYKVVSGETGYADRRLLATRPPVTGD